MGFFQKAVIISMLLVTVVVALPEQHHSIVFSEDSWSKVRELNLGHRAVSGLEWVACGYGNRLSILNFDRVLVEKVVEQKILYTVSDKDSQTVTYDGCDPVFDNKPLVVHLHLHPFGGSNPSDTDLNSYKVIKQDIPSLSAACIARHRSGRDYLMCYSDKEEWTNEHSSQAFMDVGVGNRGYAQCWLINHDNRGLCSDSYVFS